MCLLDFALLPKIALEPDGGMLPGFLCVVFLVVVLLQACAEVLAERAAAAGVEESCHSGIWGVLPHSGC
jgi:hypothetical protein